MSDENVEIVRRAFAALPDRFTPGQVDSVFSDDTLTGLFDPDVEWIPAGQSMLALDSYHGYNGVRTFWTEVLSVWDEYAVEPQEFSDEGDLVAVMMRLVGRSHRDEVEAIWSSLFTVRDSRIVQVEMFASPAGALEAAGLRGESRSRPPDSGRKWS